MTAQLDHRETFDRYCREIVRDGRFRVILYRDGLQWILQRRKPGAGARWRAVGYCVTREALRRLWRAIQRRIPPELAALPETVRGTRHD